MWSVQYTEKIIMGCLRVNISRGDSAFQIGGIERLAGLEENKGGTDPGVSITLLVVEY